MLQDKPNIKSKMCLAKSVIRVFSFPGQPNHDPNTHHCLCGADGKVFVFLSKALKWIWPSILDFIEQKSESVP